MNTTRIFGLIVFGFLVLLGWIVWNTVRLW
jgi:hypothetical protein